MLLIIANLIELFPIKYHRHIPEDRRIMPSRHHNFQFSGILFLAFNLVRPVYPCAMLTE